MKRLICLLLALLLCPIWACAELEMDVAKNSITFPGLDEMKCYFRKTSEWTIVHSGNLEEHMALLLKRGDSEEEIRARFAEESLLWEAYKTGLPEDACIRMERFVNDNSRDVWHLRHLSTKERKEFLEVVNDGRLLEKYDTFSAKYAGNGGAAYIECGFTTIPPAVHESGKMHIRYINGQEYVLSYVVRERMAGRSKLRSKRENELISGCSPFNTLSFGVKLQPKMPSFELEERFPMQVDLGEVQIAGKVTQGAKVQVILDGEKVACKVTKKGAFTATLPFREAGDHEVTFTVTHSKYTDRIETFTVNVSAERTPLNVTSMPETVALAGEHTIAGTSEPGAEIILRLDEHTAVTLLADDAGQFSHTFEIMDDQFHLLYIAAFASGKDASIMEIPFYTEYETVKDGIDAFEEQLTSYKVRELAENPEAFLGERLKISVRVKDVSFTEEGLGILCTYNPPKGSKHEKTPLYLTLHGYGQDQIQPDMTMTIYGTVQGQREVEGETRMDILVQYGTYLVSK